MTQLLVAIVQAEDADRLVDRLVEQDYRLTRINSVGSFLVRGNATILIGVEDSQVEPVLSIIRTTCRTRRGFVNAAPPVEAMAGSLVAVMPLEVLVGGAVVFQFPVQRYLRMLGGSALPVADPHQHPPAPATADESGGNQGGQMHLVLAILQSDDAEAVSGGLLTAGYRVTRLNSAGGFFRRGNVTLLIGVEGEQVDDVLRIIHANVPIRTEARPPEAGMPMYSATVFVLEAARFDRV